VTLCCGRPLYDYGMLDLAKTMLREVLEALRPQIRAGTCVVGLEPSCVSVFRDEMTNLLGPDEDAKRLSAQTFLLTEFLAKKAPDYKPPKLRRKALVQQHCHHKSILDADGEKTIFEAMELDADIPDTGCCGMAGPFGFDSGHFDVSMAVGERALLPKVREAGKNVIVVANGFSCREQISQTTDRQAIHPAQVLKMAIDDRDVTRDDEFPELRFMPDVWRESREAARRGTIGLAVLGALATLGIVLLMRRR
jgi:Fe-S oxidoreductase